jgi:DNA-binding NarL/FixJ family response regulator
LKKTRPEEACGALVVAPCGRIRFITQVASRYLKKYFGPRPDRCRLPEALDRWARAEPETPFCLVRNDQILFIRLIGRSRKQTPFFLLEERVIEEKKLSAAELLVMCWLRKAKTNEEIGEILDRKTGTVKKHVSHILDKLGAPNRTAAAYYADRFFNGEE